MSASPAIEIDVQELKRLRDQNAEFVLVDVRENEEYAIAKIDGSVLIPMSEIQGRVDELLALKDQHVVVHCHHGGRSMQVVQWLIQQGFGQVQNLQGGIDEWSSQIDSSVSKY